jgi:glycyl-tRNA synthetase beta chain
MNWGTGFRFPRPIRWLLVLFGDEVLPIEIAGVRSGSKSYGHRFLSKGPVEVKNPRDYEKILKRAFVIVDPKERREIIKRGLSKRVKAVGAVVKEDEELLEEVVNLVEWPSVVMGKFDERFLSLPAPVITTAMKQHQRYFATVDEEGRLLPYFLFVINNEEKFADGIRPGLERVLRARLEDAKFYFDEDTKRRLEERLEDLKGIVWREGLGSVYEKVMRVRELALKIAEGDNRVDPSLLERGALLCKCDLSTEMIRDGKEFTKLEGVIGMEYALHQGEDPRVAKIIYEHHLPRFAGDELPTLREAGYLGVADRLDSLCGIFSTGYEVTGSQDPLGMRRTAYGLIEVILSLDLRVDLDNALSMASMKFGDSNLRNRVLSFILERFENYLEERLGIRYDVVDAVIGSGSKDLVNLKKRALALKELMEKEPETFTRVTIGQKRVANILQGVSVSHGIREDLFEKNEERELYEVAKREKPLVEKRVSEEDFKKALRHLLNLREPIDRFFDNVFVMTEDRAIRKNRLALLRFVRGLFMTYGDFSKIVVEGGQ